MLFITAKMSGVPADTRRSSSDTRHSSSNAPSAFVDCLDRNDSGEDGETLVGSDMEDVEDMENVDLESAESIENFTFDPLCSVFGYFWWPIYYFWQRHKAKAAAEEKKRIEGTRQIYSSLPHVGEAIKDSSLATDKFATMLGEMSQTLVQFYPDDIKAAKVLDSNQNADPENPCASRDTLVATLCRRNNDINLHVIRALLAAVTFAHLMVQSAVVLVDAAWAAGLFDVPNKDWEEYWKRKYSSDYGQPLRQRPYMWEIPNCVQNLGKLLIRIQDLRRQSADWQYPMSPGQLHHLRILETVMNTIRNVYYERYDVTVGGSRKRKRSARSARLTSWWWSIKKMSRTMSKTATTMIRILHSGEFIMPPIGWWGWANSKKNSRKGGALLSARLVYELAMAVAYARDVCELVLKAAVAADAMHLIAADAIRAELLLRIQDQFEEQDQLLWDKTLIKLLRRSALTVMEGKHIKTQSDAAEKVRASNEAGKDFMMIVDGLACK